MLSTASSFGADVWKIVAAAAADMEGYQAGPFDLGTDTIHSWQQHAEHEEQRQQAQPRSCAGSRVLRHQATWPDRHSRCAGAGASCSRGLQRSSSCGRGRLCRLSLPGSAVGKAGAAAGLNSMEGAAAAAAEFQGRCNLSMCTCCQHDTATQQQCRLALQHQHQQQLVVEQAARFLHHPQQQWLLSGLQARSAQQQAWQAEMLLEHQPWEGAVSPRAAYTSCAGAFSRPGCRAFEEAATGIPSVGMCSPHVQQGVNCCAGSSCLAVSGTPPSTQHLGRQGGRTVDVLTLC